MELQKVLQLLVAHLRATHLYYHNCHNVVFGATFVADHDLFSDFYTELALDYDSVAERIVGYFGKDQLSLSKIMEDTADILKELPDPSALTVEAMLAGGKMADKELIVLCNMVDKMKDVSSGLRQLVGDIADKAEVRQYKLQQRLLS